MFKNLIIALTLSTASATAFSCTKPIPPALPDPEAAVTAQMVKAKNDMKSFIALAEEYLDCVSDNTSKYNAMVTEMQQAADDFNAIVRKYKKRMAAG